ncbi:DNA polymerase III subunit chi [Denitratisoma sp. DHT3]|uniref:DNA polymerase III subunit chi n=1 Tax=Denitratisoma sp. DHT3 TaxID=1981880 RepID=UPI001648EE56|nr:DNA polymerase III subunit chi [Denitratisoma sp. DHT3]
MTQVRFFHGTADRIAAAADWLTRSWRSRRRIVVYAPRADMAERLDRQLWIHPPIGFTPHCRNESPLAAQTPIIIASSPVPPQADTCLLNLSDELPAEFSAYGELVEIVSTDDAVRLPARERFRFYREQGCEPLSQDIAAGFDEHNGRDGRNGG